MQNKPKTGIGRILCATLLLPLSSFAADQPIGIHAANATSLLKPKTVTINAANQQAKHKKVTGQVVDEDGNTVIGASVVLKSNPKVGAVTDADGNFTLDVTNTKDVLVVSYLGYQSQMIPMKGKTIFSITLKEDAKQLGDVVVTAFGATQKKETVVGSIQTIRPNDLKVPSANLSTSFAGRMSGVVAYQRSGQPGSNGANYFIRGISTISGVTSPLIIIDGVECASADLNALDPEVIESFSILKDATATAMYGTRGANGVMIVTTKSGIDTDHPVISARVECNVTQPTRRPKFVDGVTYMKLFNEACTNQFGSGATGLYSQDKIENTALGTDPYIYPNVDWYKELFNNSAFNQKANFNIRGGSRKIDYFMNVAVNHESSMLKNRAKDFGMSYDNGIDYKRYAFQNNLNFHISKSSTISLHLNVWLSDLDGPSAGVGSFYSTIMNTNPVDFPVCYPADGTAWVKWGTTAGGQTLTTDNPVAKATQGYNNTFESEVVANLDFEQKLDFITKGLRFKALLSFKNWSQTGTYRSQGYNLYTLAGFKRNDDGTFDMDLSPKDTPTKPVLGTSGGQNGDRRYYFQAFVDYNRRFGKHNVGGMALYNQTQYNSNSVSNLYNALPRRKMGFAFRASYDYDSRYLAEFNAGYNGSENFAKGHRWGFFPSFALGYNISRESFWAPLEDIISNFKIRGSYGLVGNDQIGGERFIYLADVTLQSYGFTTGYGNNAVTYYGPSYNRYQNNEISWEIGHKLNIGFDAQLFRSLNITFDAFREIRDHIFQQKNSIPNYLGTANSRIYGNLAKVKSWGWDASVDYGVNIGKDWTVQFKGTFTYARNKVLEYDQAASIRPALSLIGHGVNDIWGYVSNGLYVDEADVANNPKSTLGNIAIAPGDIKYVDQPDADGNYDGKITVDDRVPMGYPSVPEIVYGFGPSISYKHFDFSFFMQGAARTSLMMSGFHPFGTSYNRNVLQFIADNHWSPTNQNIDATYPRLTRYDNSHNQQYSDYWLRDASFLKLKNMEIGYTYKNMRFYVSGSNLLTFSKFKLWDPEMGGGSGLSYPTQRTYNLGVSITFNKF